MVMQLQRSDHLAEAQPEPVDQIYFVRSKVGRVRPQHLIHLIAILQMNLQVELRLRISQFLPRISYMACLLLR